MKCQDCEFSQLTLFVTNLNFRKLSESHRRNCVSFYFVAWLFDTAGLGFAGYAPAKERGNLFAGVSLTMSDPIRGRAFLVLLTCMGMNVPGSAVHREYEYWGNGLFIMTGQLGDTGYERRNTFN